MFYSSVSLTGFQQLRHRFRSLGAVTGAVVHLARLSFVRLTTTTTLHSSNIITITTQFFYNFSIIKIVR